MYELHVAGITNRHDGLLMFPVLHCISGHVDPTISHVHSVSHFDIESVSEMYARMNRLII